jgi:hypothetical protein
MLIGVMVGVLLRLAASILRCQAERFRSITIVGIAPGISLMAALCPGMPVPWSGAPAVGEPGMAGADPRRQEQHGEQQD